MKRKKYFNNVEEILEYIPAWMFFSAVALLLSGIALWVEEDINIKSPHDVMRVLFKSADSISIVAGVILYFKEIPKRKVEKHSEALRIIENRNPVNFYTSHEWKRTLGVLHKDGVSLASIDFSGADLSNVNLSGANLTQANLIDVDLRKAQLS